MAWEAAEQRARFAGASMKAYAVAPRPPEGPAKLLIRGNPEQPGDTLSAGGVAALPGPDANFGLAPDAPEGERRKRLALWITDRRNPLFARVIVNRLWHHHFGVGIVDTPNDFGFNGGRPSHPELLDWLAADLIDGHSLERLHRTIVTPPRTANRRPPNPPQSAIRNPQSIDAAIGCCGERARKAFEAETRDAMLAVSGRTLHTGGPAPRFTIDKRGRARLFHALDPIGSEFERAR